MKRDKLLHLIFGMIIGIVISGIVFFLQEHGGFITDITWEKKFLLVFFGIISGTVVGLLKEFVWDLALKKGTFEMDDIQYTVLGSILGGIVVMLLSLI